MRELIKEIWSTSQRNKLRTSLTGFAVAWGIFMLIFLLGAGNGLINALTQQSNRYLANSIMAFGGTTSKAYKGLEEGRDITLNERDLRLTKLVHGDHVDEVEGSLYQNPVDISHGKDYVTSQTLTGVYPIHTHIDKLEIVEGRFINDIDMKERRKVAVLSQTQAKELQPRDYRSLAGQTVKVQGLAFRVVGIYKDDATSLNHEAFIPYTTLQTIYATGDKAGDILFTIKGLETEADNEAFETAYRATINANHQAAPDDDQTVWIWNRYTSNIQMHKGIAIVHTALWIVGLFTLLSGIVGVSNIMLITVKERTREFGIRKAIGAKPFAILKLIITESIIITAVFGYIGMVCGVVANEIMDATLGRAVMDTGMAKLTLFVNPTVGLDVCIGATAVLIIAGTVAGLIPAIKAARIRPIEALRAE